ncbi:MAG: hypothetical protein ABI743_07655, partial [bacterium]
RHRVVREYHCRLVVGEHLFVGHNHRWDQMQLGPTLGTMTAGAGSTLYKQWNWGVLQYHVAHVAIEGLKATVSMVPLA